MGTREDNVSIDRLKAAHVDDTLPVAQPPLRGRPPRVPAAQRPLEQPPLPVPTMPTTTPLPVPVPQVPKPTYAEVTTRAGRTTTPPQRFRD